MKIGKKSYVGIFLISIAAIIVVLLNASLIKADEDNYRLSISDVSEEIKSVELTVQQPIDEEIYLEFEGFEVISNETLQNSVPADFDVEIADTEKENKKKLTVKGNENPLKMSFELKLDGNSGEKSIRLLNQQAKVLLEENFSVQSPAVQQVEFDDGLVSPVAQVQTANSGMTKGLVPSTPSEIQAANDAANTRFGFNPLANVKTVGTWADFKLAYDDNNVTKIIMTANITRTNNLASRSASIEIDGGGYILDLGNDSLRLASTPSDGIGFIHFHDMTAKNAANEGEGLGGNMWAFVMATNGTTYARNWYFRAGNIETVRVNGQRVVRLIRGTRAEITLYGKMNLITTSENFYAGSIIVEDGTDWYGEDTGSNYSVNWFEIASDATDTGGKEQIIIGKNARVVMKNSTNGTAYPAMYHNWREFELGEGSVYNSNMMGNAFRISKTATVKIKKDATMNLISRGTGAVLQFGGSYGFTNTSGSQFDVEPGGSIYIVGETAGPTIDFHTTTTSRNIKMTLTSPMGFDFRNKNNSNPVLNVRQTQNEFQIIDSDIDLWNVGSPVLGPSNETYARVGNFSVKGTGGAANVTTTEPGLANFTSANYRRIAGMNSKPLSQWVPVTDADYSYKVRVMIGYTPGDNYDEHGNVILQPVYASANQAKVTFTDTFGDTHEAWTDANGYATVTDTRFNTAGGTMTASAVRGPWQEETASETTVIDVTPPEPAKVVDDKITNATKQLIAENLEAGAKVFLTITGTTANAGTMIPAGTVGADGKWTHNLSAYLNTGDTVTIYLQDNAGVAAGQAGELPFDPAAPSTNSANGNINPSPNDLSYRDATFTKATVYTVSDSIPESSLTKEQKFYRKGTEITSGIQVNDVVRYTLTVRNTKGATLDTTWKDVAITDVLPTGINFELATANLKINNTDPAAGAVTYDEGTRTLTVNAGSLASSTEAVITFDAVINRNAVGFKLKNEATALGYSPRESNNPFVPGVNPTPAYEEITATAQVETPGTIAGVLEITSGPSVLNFGVRSNNTDTRVNKAEYTEPLVVTDTRAQRDSWKLMVEVTQDLTHQTDTSKTLPGALRYKYGSRPELTLNGSPQEIYRDSSGTAGDFVISDNWSEAGDGFKLQIPAGRVQAMGEYQAEILWTLQDAN
ncbi:pectate lyase-like adhesive domain-containing protein [Enterococcus sp. LJL128]